MEHSLVIIVVVAALVFDYINGFHDAANSIATVVSTRVLSPGKAVVWAAFWALSGTGAVAQEWGDVSTGSSLGTLAFFVVFAGLVLGRRGGTAWLVINLTLLASS